MGIDLRRWQQVVVFVVLLPAISIGCAYLTSTLASGLPPRFSPLVETLGFFSAYALIFERFAESWWRWPIWRSAGVVVVPDLNGSYLGELESSFRNADGSSIRRPARIEIVQSFVSVEVRAFFPLSSSYSRVAGFLKANSGRWELHYTYWNDAATGAPDEMHSHWGAGRFWIVAGAHPPEIEGDYFNWGRGGRANYGTIVAVYSSQKLIHSLA